MSHDNRHSWHTLSAEELKSCAPGLSAKIEQIFPDASVEEVQDILFGGKFEHGWCDDCQDFMVRRVMTREEVLFNVVEAYNGEMLSDDNLLNWFHEWILEDLGITPSEWDDIQEAEDSDPRYTAYYEALSRSFMELCDRLKETFRPLPPHE